MQILVIVKSLYHAGITPNDVQVVELHDCFSANELISYEALGLCEPGICLIYDISKDKYDI